MDSHTSAHKHGSGPQHSFPHSKNSYLQPFILDSAIWQMFGHTRFADGRSRNNDFASTKNDSVSMDSAKSAEEDGASMEGSCAK